MTGVINDSGLWFFLDTHVQLDPTAEQIAESTLQATYRLKLFGVEPRVALLSHSNFGSHDNASAAKMRKVREILAHRAPRLDVDGEMQGDTAWLEDMRRRMFPNTTLKGRANLFVMPNLDAANITYNMIKVMTEGVRSEEHTSELQSLMRISYAVFCLKKKNTKLHHHVHNTHYHNH